jgi:predicted XRE-type DNA-binding protein
VIISDRIKVTQSSGNVFADLGLKNPEERLAKAELAVRIAAAIKARKLTQVAAAEVCAIDQPKISKLRRGDLYGFSTDQLLRFLTTLGQDVEIVAWDRPRRRGSVA